jgi:hypothetical protein
MLVRAALQLAQPWLGADSGMASIAADKAATAYLDHICGPGALAHAEAVRRRYGSDRTFSVPILMNAALAGLIPWEQVPHLPFELAVLPQSLVPIRTFTGGQLCVAGTDCYRPGRHVSPPGVGSGESGPLSRR